MTWSQKLTTNLNRERNNMSPYRATVYHCGAGGGVHRSFEGFPLPLRYVSFEPNRQSQGELQAQMRHSRAGPIEHEVVNAAIADRPGRRTFFEYRPYIFSSFLPLHKNLSWRYSGEKVELLTKDSVPCTTIDLVSTLRENDPAYLCMDIQGYELKALRGARRALRSSLLGIRCEVNFLKIYQDMPSLDDISEYLERRGFFLARLEKCGSGLDGPSTDCGPFSGSWEDARPAWADAIYLRTPADTLRLIKEAETPGAVVTQYLAFCFANKCGSLGLDFLLALSASRWKAVPERIPMPLRKRLLGTARKHLDRADTASLGHPPKLARLYARYRKDLARYLKSIPDHG